MVFSSPLFLFAFLPLFLACYYLVPAGWRSATILFFSYLFYAWWRPEFLLVLAAVSCATYGIALAIEAAASPQARRYWLTLGVCGNLAVLAYFKYANFGIESFNAALSTIGIAPLSMTQIILPIGVSFYIFHAISYLVDIYRGEAKPARNLVDFSAFIALFPHLVAGPVLRYHLLAEQFRSRVHSPERFARGCLIFMAGFCKKVLIADSVAPLADAAFASHAPGLADAWLGAGAYTVQLFFDFSGYSDMAIGLALMLGFVFPANFNDPYLSRSITEFWKRWHMSLSNWLREYLYVPLGGNRHGTARTYLNLFLTMLLGGLWHGAAWTFVLWGAWHGAILAAERLYDRRAGTIALPAPVAVGKTLLLVMIGWVLFRAADLGGAMLMLGGMAGFGGTSIDPAVRLAATPDRLAMLGIGTLLALSLPRLRQAAPAWAWGLVLPLFAWAVATLLAQSHTPFLYFQF
ncbi:MBOAT family O-acyltransferase [Noviherbaspirillum galbum]|uniref:Probable alginate O-acetylase AlgI n=1 Tax=Noviherbaspirillum galbum TaxID=2709383 RepID=A0A6B3SP53_9BURK|nr:MBOAT family protein [Noviherbaspirillum galbum]NEX61075.1 MBOAT family protein [Noviherbaspirillum galbum]